MACDTVDYAVKRFNLNPESGCRTRHIPLHGSEAFEPAGDEALVRDWGLDPSTARHLNTAYGDQAASILKVSRRDMDNPLVVGYPYLEAEVVWAVREEMACRVMDFLARRTPLALIDTAAAGKASARVLQIMSAELGWDTGRRLEEENTVKDRLSLGI
jgi:glycerol-3-phosphate dehydrogenase